jgi:hypothetical protein
MVMPGARKLSLRWRLIEGHKTQFCGARLVGRRLRNTGKSLMEERENEVVYVI